MREKIRLLCVFTESIYAILNRELINFQEHKREKQRDKSFLEKVLRGIANIVHRNVAELA